jgi:hypothetical protein
MLGKGGAYTLISTGEQTDATLGLNYTPSNIIVQTTGALSSGNVRVSMTTSSTTTATGALQVLGGVGVSGNLNVGSLAIPGALHTIIGNVDVTGAGTEYFNIGGNILAVAGTMGSLLVNGNVTVTSAYMVPSANAASSLGSSATRWNFIYGVNGNFLSVNANYADLAEKYVADAEYAPGTVLMFGGDKEVTQCVHDMCSRVAGVVSTNPAYLMNSGLEGEHTVELALTGRVPTKVRGPILKGDLIVSAGDGHARAEGLPQVGTVIGKALEDFDGDSGVIEVVVGKH